MINICDMTSDATIRMHIMDILRNKFMEECHKVNALYPNKNCDTEFMQNFIKAYEYYVICMNMPEDNAFKPHYLGLLDDTLKKIEVS